LRLVSPNLSIGSQNHTIITCTDNNSNPIHGFAHAICRCYITPTPRRFLHLCHIQRYE